MQARPPRRPARHCRTGSAAAVTRVAASTHLQHLVQEICQNYPRGMPGRPNHTPPACPERLPGPSRPPPGPYRTGRHLPQRAAAAAPLVARARPLSRWCRGLPGGAPTMTPAAVAHARDAHTGAARRDGWRAALASGRGAPARPHSRWLRALAAACRHPLLLTVRRPPSCLGSAVATG